LLNERASNPANLLHAKCGRNGGETGSSRTVGLGQKLDEVVPEPGTTLGLGKKALGQLLGAGRLLRSQSRSYGSPARESALRIGGRQDLGNFLLKE